MDYCLKIIAFSLNYTKELFQDKITYIDNLNFATLSKAIHEYKSFFYNNVFSLLSNLNMGEDKDRDNFKQINVAYSADEFYQRIILKLEESINIFQNLVYEQINESYFSFLSTVKN